MRRATPFAALAVLAVSAAASPAALAQSGPNWNGFYIGGNVGGAFGDDGGRSSPTGSPSFVETSRNSSFSGGGQGGYNARFGLTVVGFEADWQAVSLRRGITTSRTSTAPGTPGTPGTPGIPEVPPTPSSCTITVEGTTIAVPFPTDGITCGALMGTFVPATPGSPAIPAVAGLPGTPAVTTTTIQTFTGHLNGFGTVRGRFGLVTYENFLLYATGGFAYGDARFTAGTTTIMTTAGAPTITTSSVFARTKTLTGYAVGGGVEYAFTPNWSLKGEYLYVDLGRDGIAGQRVGFNTNVARFGVNYRF